MRKSCFFWILFCMVLLINSGKTQSTAMLYQLEVTPGQNLEEAIERLARDYQIDFAYAPGVLAKNQLEPAYFSCPSIEVLLRQLLAEMPVQYHILAEDRILLRGISLKKEAKSNSSRLLTGRIIDSAGGQPLMNVAIALDTLNLGTLSDEQGRFSLTIPPDLTGCSLWIYHIGYQTQRLSLAEFLKEQAIQLVSEPLSLNEILIVDQLPRLSTSSREGSIQMHDNALLETNASVLAGNDVFRRVQLLAGVSADDDLSSDIKIRGSNADETLIILDAMPLYKVDHFYGIFSALNSNYLQTVELYKNAMPIQYGGRTGGMLLMQSTDEVERLSGQADLDLLSAALKMNLPLGKKLGLSFSGRSSHTNLADSKFFDWVDQPVENYVDNTSEINRPDILTTNPEFGFSDWNAKLLFQPADNHRLAFNFYRSTDHYLNDYNNNFRTRFQQKRVSYEEDFYNEQSWQNTGTSLQYFGNLGKEWQLEVDGFYTNFQFSELLDFQISRTAPNLGTRSTTLQNDQSNQVSHAGTRWLLNKNYGAGQLLQLGGSWNHYRTDFNLISEIDTLLASEGQSFDVQGFVNYQWNLLPRLQINLGSRLNYYQQTGGTYLAPRLTANYRFDNGLRLKASYSINYQFIREITHENRLGQSVDLVVLSDDQRFPVGQSNNYMLGVGYQTKHWLFDLELYHKKLAKVIEYSSLLAGFGNDPLRPGTRQSYLIFLGEGTVKGADVTLGWEYPRYQGHLAYTLSKAVNNFPQIQRGTSIPSRDDRRHQLKWINTWTLGRFGVSANYIYSSGRPYFDQGALENDRRRELVRRLPSYQRLDVGVDYNFKLGAAAKAKIGVSVFNLTDNANVKYLQFIYSTNSEENNRLINRIIGSQTDLLDRTLNVSLGVEF